MKNKKEISLIAFEIFNEMRQNKARLEDFDLHSEIQTYGLSANEAAKSEPIVRAKIDRLINSRRVAARALGSIRSERKAESSRRNGKLGGRPKKAE